MKRSIGVFVEKCIACQQAKVEYERPSRLLNPLEIQNENGNLFRWIFLVIFIKSAKGNNAIWVIIDQLT